jgi:chromosome segregation protein
MDGQALVVGQSSSLGPPRCVRFVAVTLAGFGRYQQPTRFHLGGISRTFTSPNELGKTTFLRGLLYTLFGLPGGRERESFLQQYRNWSRPKDFWGEVVLTANQGTYRIRRDFARERLSVYQLGEAGQTVLIQKLRHRQARPEQPSSHPYDQLLDEWFGFHDLELYLALFTINQDSHLLQRWQLDPRAWSYLYGAAVGQLEKRQEELFEQFRALTCKTRDYGVVLGSRGERNGRYGGRLEAVLERCEEIQARLQALSTELAPPTREPTTDQLARRKHLEEVRACLQQKITLWSEWLELEGRVQEDLERLQQLRRVHGELQQLGPEPALSEHEEWLAHLIGEEPSQEFIEALERFARWEAEHKARRDALAAARQLREERQRELEQLRAEADRLSAFATIPELPARLLQLRELHATLNDLEVARQELKRLAEEQILSVTKGLPPPETLEEAETGLGQFQREHASFEQLLQEIQQLEAEQLQCAGELEANLQELSQLEGVRQRELEVLQRQVTLAQQALAERLAGEEELRRFENDHLQRFAQLVDAPPELPMLWDRLQAIERERGELDRALQQADLAQRLSRSRRFWNRGLTTVGGLATALIVWMARDWIDWTAAAGSVLLTTLARRAFRPTKARPTEEIHHLRDSRRQLEQEARAIRQLLGPHFQPSPAVENRLRPLWVPYQQSRQELERRRRELQKQPTVESLQKRVAELQQELSDAELAIRAALQSQRSRCEGLQKRLIELQDEIASRKASASQHVEKWFGLSDLAAWAAMDVGRLPPRWKPLLELAHSLGHTLTTTRQLVSWALAMRPDQLRAQWQGLCESKDAEAQQRLETSHQDWAREVWLAWNRFRPACSVDAFASHATSATVDRPWGMQTNEGLSLTDFDPAAKLAELKQLAKLLEEELQPVGVDTDPHWVVAQQRDYQALVELMQELEGRLAALPDLRTLQEELEALEALRPTDADPMEELLDQYGGSPMELLAAVRSWAARCQTRKARQTLLQQVGCVSEAQLMEQMGELEARLSNARQRSEWLLQQYPELLEGVGQPPVFVEERMAQWTTELGAVDQELRALQQLEASGPSGEVSEDLLQERARLEAELQELQAEAEAWRHKCQELAHEFQALQEQKQTLQAERRKQLQERISGLFAAFSCRSERAVELDSEFRLWVHEPAAGRHHPEQLSHGARDQLCLAVYLAAAAHLDLPFLFEDPFVNCDEERLQAIRRHWVDLAQQRQFLLLSHNTQLASWAEPVQVEVLQIDG